MGIEAIREFFGPDRWTFAFWEWGAGYTIVKNRHIGLDVGSRGRVPSLLPGRVVRVVKTLTLGYVVIIDTGRSHGRYHSHCHMSGHGLPREGDWVEQGQEFATVATGPKGLPASDPNFGGTLWDGAHDHLVVHNKIGGAYLYGQDDEYYDPADVIREVLAQPASVEDEMTEDDFNRIQGMITDAVVKVQKSTQNQLEARMTRIQKMVTEAVIKVQKSTQSQLEGRISRIAKAVWGAKPAVGSTESVDAGSQDAKKL